MESKRQPLISICIPTYNREKYLKECLDNIINQDGFNEEDIEIVISDNASKDNTSSLVKQYQNKYKNIRYSKNQENLGFSRNFIKVSNLAEGEYMRFLSDDDIIADNSIKIVKKNIIKNKPDFVFCNFDQFDIEFSNKNTQNNLRLDRDHFFENKKDFFQFISEVNDAHFISSNNFFFRMSTKLVKRSFHEKNINLIQNLERDINFFPQNEGFFFTENDGKTLIIKDSIILYRTGNYGKVDLTAERLLCNRRIIMLYRNIIKYNKKYIPIEYLNQLSKWINHILTNEYRVYIMFTSKTNFKTRGCFNEINAFY